MESLEELLARRVAFDQSRREGRKAMWVAIAVSVAIMSFGFGFQAPTSASAVQMAVSAKDQSKLSSVFQGEHVPFIQEDPWRWIPVRTKSYGRYYYEQATGARDADGDVVPRIEVDAPRSGAGGKRSDAGNPQEVATLVPVLREEPYRPRLEIEMPEPVEDDPLKAYAAARAYVATTATPGGTMSRQGREKAVECLHPEFALRLASAIKDAREQGMERVGVFSACRPPVFGVGGFRDKFLSLHAYGLAVDVTGIGGPGSEQTKQWHSIARRHGVVCPYGPYNRAEFNHCQPTETRAIPGAHPLRKTITAQGPIDLEWMWTVAKSMIVNAAKVALPDATPRRQVARARVAQRHVPRRRYARAGRHYQRVARAPQKEKPLWQNQ